MTPKEKISNSESFISHQGSENDTVEGENSNLTKNKIFSTGDVLVFPYAKNNTIVSTKTSNSSGNIKKVDDNTTYILF